MLHELFCIKKTNKQKKNLKLQHAIKTLNDHIKLCHLLINMINIFFRFVVYQFFFFDRLGFSKLCLQIYLASNTVFFHPRVITIPISKKNTFSFETNQIRLVKCSLVCCCLHKMKALSGYINTVNLLLNLIGRKIHTK